MHSTTALLRPTALLELLVPAKPPQCAPLSAALLSAALLLTGVLSWGCSPGTDSGNPAEGERPTSRAQTPGQADDDASFEELRNEAFRMHEAQEEPGRVLEALLAAHALDPDAYGVNRRLGQTYADIKLNLEALKHYRLARIAKPEAMQDGLAVVRLALAQGLHEEALSELEPLLKHEATRGEALYHQAGLLDFQGDRPGALSVARLASALGPDQAYHAISLHGRFTLEAGDFAQAEALFRTALAGRPDYKEALRGMADACRRQQRPEEAARWDRVLGLFLDLTDNVFIRKRPEERRRTLQALVAEYPAWTPAFAQLALLLRREGDRAGACQVIETFLDEHAPLVGPAEAAALRDRFCTGIDP